MDLDNKTVTDAENADGLTEVIDNGKRNKKTLIITGVVSFVVAFVIGSSFFAWDYIENYVMKLFCSSDGYYHYIEEKNSDLIAELFSETISAANLDSAYSKNERSLNVKVYDTQTVGHFANRYLGIDKSLVEEYSNTKFSAQIISGDRVQKTEVSLLKNGALQFGFDLILDVENNIVYLDTNKTEGKKYLLFDLKKDSETLADVSKLFAYVPGFSQSKNIFNRCFSAAVETIDGVESESTKIFANGISQDCTKLTYELYGDDVKEILRALLGQLYSDKEVEKIIKKSSEDLFTKYRTLIDGLLSDVEGLNLEHVGMKISTFVDSKGTIIGKKINSIESMDSFYFYTASDCNLLTHNGDIAVECGFNGVKVAGKGVVQSGFIDMQLGVYYKGYKFSDIAVSKLDGRMLKNGYIKCNINMSIPEEAHKFIKFESGLDLNDAEKLLNMRFVAKLDNSRNASDNHFQIMSNDKTLVEITTSKKKGKGAEIIIPKDCEKQNLMEFIENEKLF